MGLTGSPITEREARGAVLSDCGTYRYALWRDTQPPLGVYRPGALLFVMLNPSTADASDDDPTIRRCVAFAGREGYGRMAVANLYALRATDPRELDDADDPIGPDCDYWIAKLAADSDVAVAAWGANKHASAQRIAAVADLLGPHRLTCLGTTKAGAPRHPLYVAGCTALTPWTRGSS